MNVTHTSPCVRAALARLAAASVALIAVPSAHGQQAAAARPTPVARLAVEPTSLSLSAGDTASFRIVAYDAQGKVIAEPQLRGSAPRTALQVGPGESRDRARVKAIRAGTYEIVMSSVPPDSTVAVATVTIPVTVKWPALTRIVITPDSGLPRLRRSSGASTPCETAFLVS